MASSSNDSRNSSPNDSRNSSPNHVYISEEQSDYVNSSDEQENEYESPVYDPRFPRDEQEPPRKRMKRSKVDRITNLPDSLITHILSLMPVETAVRTQLLSKRWRYAWASNPVLTFSRKDYDRYSYKCKFITNALMLHKGKLKSLSLLRIKDPEYGVKPPINLWVQCAVNKQIEVFVFEVDRFEQSYSLPHCFFLCDSLREFSLTASRFDLGSSLFWKSLRKLSLSDVMNLYNDKIHKIIEGSPELESLNLSHCAGFSRIIVSSGSKLRNLVIKDGRKQENQDDKRDDLLEISGPSIRSLEIVGYVGWQDFRLKDVSSLVQVSFRFYIHSMEDYNQRSSNVSRAMELIQQLIRKISHVEKLSFGTWCTQVLSMCELGGEPTIPLQCKTLEIFTLHEESVPGIARLLRTSRYLERLTIYTELCYQSCRYDHEIEYSDALLHFDGKNYWKSPERAAFNNPLQHLKVVQFIGLFERMERKYTVELAEYVLDHAKVLEKLVLKPEEDAYEQCRSSDLRDSSLFQVMQELLSYPRCSRHARVLLS